MVRYAIELEAALRVVGGDEWDWQTLHVAPRADMSEQWGSRLARFVDYPRAIARTKADVYHVLDHSHANLTRAIPASKAVITCHDIIPYLAALGKIPMPSGRLTRYTFPERLRCIRRCRRVIADSEATRQDLLEYGHLSPEQVKVVYPGIKPLFSPLPVAEAAHRRARLRTDYKLSPEALLVLQVASPTRYKNTPTVLRALQQLVNEPELAKRTYLLRVGADFFPDEDALINELGIRQFIIHAGRLPTDEALVEHYRCADAFAFPSLWEGFGWPPLEAMACGLVPVTSNVASLPEVVGDAGLQIAPTDASGLATALYRLLSDADFKAQRSQACVTRAASFSWEASARGVLDTYGEVLASH